MVVVLCAHPVRVESHIQHNADREVATKVSSIVVYLMCIVCAARAMIELRTVRLRQKRK